MAPTLTRLECGHWSAEFRDTREQQKADCEKIFRLADSRGLAWITGTEAGPLDSNHLRELLALAANKYGYVFMVARGSDAWIAVKKSFISGSLNAEYVPVLDQHEGVGRHTARGVFYVEFDNEELGHITIITTHYLTKGRPGNPAENPNLALNKKLAAAVDKVAREKGQGRNLVFYGGDQNIVDKTHDTFFGGILVSAWDELGRYEGTGHGNIDVIASSSLDGRVKAIFIRALDDREFRLFGDHFFVHCGFDVEQLPKPKPKPTLHKCGSCGDKHLGVVDGK